MSAKTPTRPSTEPELDGETKAILEQRLKTLEGDAKNAVDAREALKEIRRNLIKTSVPR